MNVPQTKTRHVATAVCAAVTALAVVVLAAPSSAPAAYPNPTISATQTGNLTAQFGAGNVAGATSLDWDFGDGTTHAADANPVHTYAAANNYNVTLTAIYPQDPNDPMAATTVSATLTAFHVYATPAASFTVGTPSANGTVQFTAGSGGEPTNWTWTFTPPAPSSPFTVTGQSPALQLPVGTTQFTLTVANPAGSSSAQGSVVVNAPPVAGFSITPTIAGTDAPIVLNASSSSDANGDPLTFNWDLDGNGTYTDATGPLQTLSFATPGTYKIGVLVSDGHNTSTFRDFVTVLADKAPIVDFTTTPAAPTIGAPVTFSATSSDSDGTVIKLEWDLDDDGRFEDGTGPTATTVFNTSGSRIVAVRATDDKGVTTIAFHTINVTGSTTGPSVTPSPPGSTPVQAPKDSASSLRRLSLLSPFPIIRIRGLIYRRWVQITLLTIEAPKGATVKVVCHGRGCSKKKLTRHVRFAKQPVRFRSLERRLHGGSLIEVFVTAPRRIGKYTSFRIRADAAPARTDLCLRPGKSKPVRCPA